MKECEGWGTDIFKSDNQGSTGILENESQGSTGKMRTKAGEA